MDTPLSLAHGNRLQRAYHRWALPHYERVGARDPEMRRQMEEIDLLLYTRKGLGAWIGWWMGGIGLTLGLHAAGMTLATALGAAAAVWIGGSLALFAVWLGARQPSSARRGEPLKRFIVGLGLGSLLGLAGMLLGAGAARGGLAWADVWATLERLAPGFLLVLLGTQLVLSIVWQVSRKTFEQQLERSRLQQERDAAAAQALEADLRLLQAQIQPHFVFNTLATLQHWVDRRDERAGPLLRELSGFLRRSTELLGRREVPLAEELQAVRHYLSILQQRMGGRLAWQVQVDATSCERPVPPGLLLTLVENAVQHGLEPKIGGGRLNVQAQAADGGWWLRVEDDGLGLAGDIAEGVGLANVRRRLQLQHGEQARLVLRPRAEGGTLAEVVFA